MQRTAGSSPLLGCRQIQLSAHIKLKCAPQLPFPAPSSAWEKWQEKSSSQGPHVIKGRHCSCSPGVSRPNTCSPLTYFLHSTVSRSVLIVPQAPFSLFLFLITEVRCVYRDERNSIKYIRRTSEFSSPPISDPTDVITNDYILVCLLLAFPALFQNASGSNAHNVSQITCFTEH